MRRRTYGSPDLIRLNSQLVVKMKAPANGELAGAQKGKTTERTRMYIPFTFGSQAQLIASGRADLPGRSARVLCPFGGFPPGQMPVEAMAAAKALVRQRSRLCSS